MAILRTEHLTKDYPGCRALDDVNVSFESGKVNALLGKNGSGKSTLVKCFSGAIRQSTGEFYLDDEKCNFSKPTEAYGHGFATVYQEMSLVSGLTVTENIFLGRMPKKGGLIDWNKAHADAKRMLDMMKVNINPKEIVSRLSMWQCQVVEITKAMSYHPKVLMLDEPTSALASAEINILFDVIRELKKQDVIIIYISHKLHEIPQIADTVTVLRDGHMIGKVNIEDVKHKDILGMMFGDVVIRNRPADIIPQEEVVLKVENLTRKGKFENISFELHRSEVLGIAGMLGSGRTELLKSIFGADPYDSGSIYINGVKVKQNASPITMKKNGLGLTPEDRKKEGLILIHSIQDNLCYASMSRTAVGWMENKRFRSKIAEEQIEGLQIKVPSVKATAGSLSGGNQQKVVVGNWLNTLPKIMLYDEPSRGIDVAAKQQIFEIMWEQSKHGISTIFVSSELEELLETCNRILIMSDGQITGEAVPEELTVEALYSLCMED